MPEKDRMDKANPQEDQYPLEENIQGIFGPRHKQIKAKAKQDGKDHIKIVQDENPIKADGIIVYIPGIMAKNPYIGKEHPQKGKAPDSVHYFNSFL